MIYACFRKRHDYLPRFDTGRMIRSNTHPHMYADTHTRTHMHTRTHTHTNTHHKQSLSLSLSLSLSHKHTLTYALTHALTRTPNTHTHTISKLYKAVAPMGRRRVALPGKEHSLHGPHLHVYACMGICIHDRVCVCVLCNFNLQVYRVVCVIIVRSSCEC